MSIMVTDRDGSEIVAADRDELVAYLDRVASPEYAGHVLNWFDEIGELFPFEIANGTGDNDIETWQITTLKRPPIPASAFKGKRQG